MSRIEIRNTNTGQPTLVNEGEHKGKHGTDGFVKKASFLARIFGYYVKVGEHYLNPKSLANYTNEKNAGKEGAPVLKPRWIGGTPNSKIKDAFLALFPKNGTTPQTTNNPSAPLQQQTAASSRISSDQTSPPSIFPTLLQQQTVAPSSISSDQTSPPLNPSSPLKYTETLQPASFDDMHQVINSMFDNRELQNDLRVALSNPAFEVKFKNDLMTYLDNMPEQIDHGFSTERWWLIKLDILATVAKEVVDHIKNDNFIFDHPLPYYERKIFTFYQWPRGNQTPTSLPQSATAPSEKTPPLKYEGTKPISFDMQQINSIYTNDELRENLHTAFNDPAFEAKFTNDLQAYLNTIPVQFPDQQKCSAESWTKAIEVLKTEIINRAVSTVKHGVSDSALNVFSPELARFGPERQAYINQIRRRFIVDRTIAIEGPRDYFHIGKESENTPVIQPGPHSSIQPESPKPFSTDQLFDMVQDSIQKGAGTHVTTTHSSTPIQSLEPEPKTIPGNTPSDHPPTPPVISTPPLKYEGTKPVSFDMHQIGSIYTDKELRKNLRAAFEDPAFIAKFKNDLATYLDTIPDQFGQTCSPEDWSRMTNHIKSETVYRIIAAVEHDYDGCILNLQSKYLVNVPERDKYLMEFINRHIITDERIIIGGF